MRQNKSYPLDFKTVVFRVNCGKASFFLKLSTSKEDSEDERAVTTPLEQDGTFPFSVLFSLFLGRL